MSEYIKRIPVQVVVNEYLITFEYQTVKGYNREQQRVIRHFNKELAIKCFKEWSSKSRTMLNAKILSIVKSEKETKVIDI